MGGDDYSAAASGSANSSVDAASLAREKRRSSGTSSAKPSKGVTASYDSIGRRSTSVDTFGTNSQKVQQQRSRQEQSVQLQRSKRAGSSRRPSETSSTACGPALGNLRAGSVLVGWGDAPRYSPG